jgi:sulfate adenylyltransferase (ADP) / ATP adenylyltransferase
MADARARAGAVVHVPRGGLWEAIQRRSELALARGALEPIATETVQVPDGGIPFVVRAVSALASRRRRLAARDPAHDPFLTPDPELVVGAIGQSHLCVLNRFPVIPHHALIVTREFQDQEAPLGRADFAAAWTCLREMGGLAFYNAGEAAGASQKHRHLQLVPTPLVEPPLATPLDAVQGDAEFANEIGRIRALPFLHGLCRLRAIESRSPEQAADVLLALYLELARAFGCQRHGQPYNLLLCREWMLLVPRARGVWRGVGVNGLGFAGALMVPGAAELEVVRREGPLRVLAHVAVPVQPR